MMAGIQEKVEDARSFKDGKAPERHFFLSSSKLGPSMGSRKHIQGWKKLNTIIYRPFLL